MKFYVMLNDDIVILKTIKEAEEVANSYLNDGSVKYIEYGVLNYESWNGMSAIAILKNEVFN